MEERLDDITFIQDTKHIPMEPWHRYDVLLAARGYSWDYMLDSADYIAEADLDNVSQVITFSLGMGKEHDVTASYHEHNGKCTETPELKAENGGLSVAGISRTLKAPMKTVWFNQTQVLRFYTLIDDELTIRKYAETLIRHSFGTEDAMKLGKDLQ